MPLPSETTTRVAAGGRVVIPANYRRALGLKTGDEVVLRLEDGQVSLYAREVARRRAQEYVKGLVGPGTSLAEELIRERRREATRE